jgi:hypothetical protein
MQSFLQDLQSIVEENIKLLASADDDIASYQKWGARRAVLFTRLEEVQLTDDELAAATSLIKEITSLDAKILSTLEQNLATLGEKINAATKVQQALAHSGGFHHLALMERVV